MCGREVLSFFPLVVVREMNHSEHGMANSPAISGPQHAGVCFHAK